MSRFTVLLLIHLKVLITSGTKSSSAACLDREHLGKETLICRVARAGWEDAGYTAVTLQPCRWLHRSCLVELCGAGGPIISML